MIRPDLELDLREYLRAVGRLLTQAIETKDIYLAAAREVSGLEDLELSKEQRTQLKKAVIGSIYGMEPWGLMQILGRT